MRLSNIDEIMKIANKFNYVPINLSNLSILEIIHLFNQATHLIVVTFTMSFIVEFKNKISYFCGI